MGLAMVVGMQSVLVTGAGGFIGSNLCPVLAASGWQVRAAARQPVEGVSTALIDNLGPHTDWAQALEGITAIVHLAARVHVLQEQQEEPRSHFRRVNVHATRHLAEAAIAAGVRRFVFISTIGVHGISTQHRGFCEDDTPNPLNDYALSKIEAEEALRETAAGSGMEIVILRPPLVYGPGVKANFLHLLEVVAKGMPLPLDSIKNRRDLLYVGNLSDAVLTCLTHPRAAGEAFLVADGQPVSTPCLLRQTAAHMGKRARLLPCPPAWLNYAAQLLKKQATMQRLTGSLEVDITKIRTLLDWHPPYAFDDGLRETVAWYSRRL